MKNKETFGFYIPTSYVKSVLENWEEVMWSRHPAFSNFNNLQHLIKTCREISFMQVFWRWSASPLLLQLISRESSDLFLNTFSEILGSVLLKLMSLGSEVIDCTINGQNQPIPEILDRH